MADFDIKPEDIKDTSGLGDKISEMYNRSKATMDLRTNNFELFTKISHNMNLYEKRRNTEFSEGTTQALKRKLRAQTLQRVPDGEITTQFDKNSIEQVETEFLFDTKIVRSEFDGKDMMKNLWRAFNTSYDYGFACIRTGFERDLDGDLRISWKQIGWNDVYPAPDCDFIEEAEWYVIREYISRAEIKALIDWDTETVKDKTYFEDTVKFLSDWEPSEGPEYDSIPLADKKKGVTKVESIEVLTLYKRGADEFYSYVPSCHAMLRMVKNEDPRKDVPIHFLILEPDPEFPLGCSSVMWTLAQQQFADAFQTSAYQTLLLATKPPIMATGNLMNAKIRMEPAAFWDLGNNPNNKIEKFPVETTTITQYGSILENIGANMMKNLNVTDQTIASDANVARYSGTAPGVHEQAKDKTITINQYAKRIEIFFCEWANHALRSYIASMGGKIKMTVDEPTRRRIWDIEMARDQRRKQSGEKPGESIIDGDKIEIDFDNLSTDLLSFSVRAGSLIETREEEERRNIQEMLIPVSQMLGNVSEKNRGAFEQNIMQMMARLFDLSNIDVSAQTSQRIDDQLLLEAQRATMDQVMAQQQQINQIAQQIMPNQGQQQPGATPNQGPQDQQQPSLAQPQGPQGQQQPGLMPNQEPLETIRAPQPDNPGLTPELQQGVPSDMNQISAQGNLQ